MARPVEWEGEKKQKAIEKILYEASLGKSIRQILSDSEDLPSRKTFHEWMAQDKQLSDHYAHICELRAEMIFDEMLEIADDGTNDYVENKNGELVIDNEHVQRSKLRIDTRKWILSKMVPKKYGDKTDITTNGKDIVGKSMTDMELREEIERLRKINEQ